MPHPRRALTIRRTLLAASLALLTACGENLSREELLDRARGALAGPPRLKTWPHQLDKWIIVKMHAHEFN